VVPAQNAQKRTQPESEKKVSNHVDDTVETKSAEPITSKSASESKANDMPTGSVDSDADPDASDASELGDDDDFDPTIDPTVEKRSAIKKLEPGEHFDEDGRADQALDFVVAILSKMGMDCTVDLMENEETDPPTDVRIEINGNDANRLIGRKGQTLGALQFIANRVINRPSMVRRHVLIDSDGYRARREQALSSMATRLGKQAVDEGKIITFEPMSAQDRRVVHLALATFPGVVTKSEGKGATRRVQIIPVRD
jgi:spoIIIJ-associated protein